MQCKRGSQMFMYLKVTFKQRWLTMLLVVTSLAFLGIAYGWSQAVTEQIKIQAHTDLKEHWRWQYDLLVYPDEARSTFEGLNNEWIAPQTSVASYGGISYDDLDLIRNIPGVEVAAPLSMIGYFEYDTISVEYDDAQPNMLYEINRQMTAFDGLQHIDVLSQTYYQEYAPEVEIGSMEDLEKYDWARYPIQPTVGIRLFNEMMLVAIDPMEEEKLYSLSASIVDGTDLLEAQVQSTNGVNVIPILFLHNPHFQVEDTVQFSKVHLPDGMETVQLQEQGLVDIDSLPRSPVTSLTLPTFSPEWRYNQVNVSLKNNDDYDLRGYQLSYFDRQLERYSPIQYELKSETDGEIPQLMARKQSIDSIYSYLFDIPHYRTQMENESYVEFGIDIIGYYDSEQILPIISSGKTKADTVDLYTPHHSLIVQNGAGQDIDPTPLIPLPLKSTYYSGAPDAITTMDAANIFYRNEPPISSVRVVVKGVDERTEANQRKIEQIAQTIMDKTGHHVHIMLGSSSSRVEIQLAGQAENEIGVVEEGWQQQGVSWHIEEHIENSNQLLFIYLLIMITVLCYTLNTHSLIKRSTEFSMLRAIGWSRKKIIIGLILELFIVSVVSTVPLLILSFLATFHVQMVDALIIYLINLSILFISYMTGSRKSLWEAPRSGLTGEGQHLIVFKRLIRIRGLLSFALHQLFKRPLRFGLLCLTVSLTVFMLILFAATQYSLSDYLYLSFLGEVVDLNLQLYQQWFLISGILLSFGVLFLLILLHLHERKNEFSMMKAIGWSDRQLYLLITFESFVVAGVGSFIGTGSAYIVLSNYSNLLLPIWVIGVSLCVPVILLILYSWSILIWQNKTRKLTLSNSR